MREINKKKDKILFFVPRILMIVYIIFISMFAFDVFNENQMFLESLIELCIQLIPSIMLSIILWYAWNNQKNGGFLLIGVGVIFTLFFELYTNFTTFLMLGVPIFISGILFLLNYQLKNEYN